MPRTARARQKANHHPRVLQIPRPRHGYRPAERDPAATNACSPTSFFPTTSDLYPGIACLFRRCSRPADLIWQKASRSSDSCPAPFDEFISEPEIKSASSRQPPGIFWCGAKQDRLVALSCYVLLGITAVGRGAPVTAPPAQRAIARAVADRAATIPGIPFASLSRLRASAWIVQESDVTRQTFAPQRPPLSFRPSGG